MAIKPTTPPVRTARTVFQETVQQHHNNLQAVFPLWHSRRAGERESGPQMSQLRAVLWTRRRHVMRLTVLESNINKKSEDFFFHIYPFTAALCRRHCHKSTFVQLHCWIVACEFLHSEQSFKIYEYRINVLSTRGQTFRSLLLLLLNQTLPCGPNSWPINGNSTSWVQKLLKSNTNKCPRTVPYRTVLMNVFWLWLDLKNLPRISTRSTRHCSTTMAYEVTALLQVHTVTALFHNI